MKKFALLFTFILSIFAAVSIAQEKPEWTRIETTNKEISASLPPDFLVDAKTKIRDQERRIFGFQNGVLMEIKISKPDSPQRSLNQIRSPLSDTAKISTFNFNGVPGKTFVSKSDQYLNVVYLATKDYLYAFSIRAADANRAEANRFFCSIKMQDKSLYTCKEKFSESKGEAVLIESIETSPKVLEALNRKNDGKDGKITYALEMVGKVNAANENPLKRPPIILERGPIKPRALRANGNIVRGISSVKFRAMLLANGQIGDITMLSNLDKDYLGQFVEAARKSKFIPAELDGKPVDSEYTFAYTIETF